MEKNKHKPDEYSSCSGEKVWWICSENPCGCHRWSSAIACRVYGQDCPFCNSGRVCPHNNFAVKYPEIAKEWNYERNLKRPEEYPYGSTEYARLIRVIVIDGIQLLIAEPVITTVAHFAVIKNYAHTTIWLIFIQK